MNFNLPSTAQGYLGTNYTSKFVLYQFEIPVNKSHEREKKKLAKPSQISQQEGKQKNVWEENNNYY